MKGRLEMLSLSGQSLTLYNWKRGMTFFWAGSHLCHSRDNAFEKFEWQESDWFKAG